MRLLAFDTAGNGCSAGVLANAVPLAMRWSAGGIGHAERLPRLIEAVLAEAGCSPGELDGLAVTIGPGSFSGIRTGLAAARGLALVTGLRAFPVTTLEALAAPLLHGAVASTPVAALLDARRGQVFIQRFDATGAALDAPQALAPEAAAATLDGDWRLVGDGAARLAPHRRAQCWSITPGRLDAAGAALAAELARARGAAPVAGFALGPCYARDSDARPGAGRPLLRLEA